MARLMSQARGGCYEAAPEAISAVLDRIYPPVKGECLVLDPCASRGMAVLQIANHLDAEPFGVELSEDRAAILKMFLEDDALAPADYLRTAMSPQSFSFVWSNPPFDSDSDGRVELSFARKAISSLVDGGVLAFVCPQDVAEQYDTIEFMEERCEQISAVPFPADVRRFNEVVVLGRKKKSPGPVPWSARYDWLEKKFEVHLEYVLPPGHRPKVFRKTEPTDTELVRMVATSPLRFMLSPTADLVDYRPRPPMSPGVGHRALLLAAGHIDGLICPPGERPHVIRGTAIKDKYVSSHDETEDDKGNITRKTVISERPRLMIRVLDAHGTIVTLE